MLMKPPLSPLYIPRLSMDYIQGRPLHRQVEAGTVGGEVKNSQVERNEKLSELLCAYSVH